MDTRVMMNSPVVSPRLSAIEVTLNKIMLGALILYLALVIGSTVTFDGVTVDSGVASGTGSSAYGIRAIDNSTVTVTDSSVQARNGVAGAAGTAGTAGAAGANGGNGASGNGSWGTGPWDHGHANSWNQTGNKFSA
jgi:hypothetical protein